jgi:hypothetical protein
VACGSTKPLKAMDMPSGINKKANVYRSAMIAAIVR